VGPMRKKGGAGTYSRLTNAEEGGQPQYYLLSLPGEEKLFRDVMHVKGGRTEPGVGLWLRQVC